MNYHNLAELKELLAARYTVVEICEILGLSTHMLVELLSSTIEENQDSLEDLVRE
jgi:hypothetical protein